MGLHEQAGSIARIDDEIYKILGKHTQSLKSSEEWKAMLTELEQYWRKTFNGISLDDDVYRLMALVKFRIGVCLAQEEDRLVEAVEYFKQVWIQIGAFVQAGEVEREFVRGLGQATAYAGSRLVPMGGKPTLDEAIAAQAACTIIMGASALADDFC